jgi:hypothetical protein
MNIGIATNIKNGIGLATEFELLRDHLQELGHSVQGIQFDEETPDLEEPLDLMISLETVCRHLFELAPVHWLIPNPEWTKRHDLDLIGRSFNKILCKTLEGTRIFKELYPEITYYTGFLARDQFDPSIARLPLFLHIGGNSSFRGTQAILDAWRWKKNGLTLAGRGATLYIVSTALKERPEVEGVKYFERLPAGDLRAMQNRCLFHLYPSGTEGFGHALREGMSVNASILTTDAPPMNELKSVHTIQPVGWEQYNLAKVYEVSALDIYSAVESMLELHREGHRRDDTREEFLQGNMRFKANLAEHLDEFIPRTQRIARIATGGSLCVAFLGNFGAAESTENMILWALNELGHEVECLQENEATLHKIQQAGRSNDLFLWVRTPGWLKIDDDLMTDWLRTTNVKTASIHLDRFWGIPDREALIGVHPFWKTDTVFTADGGNQAGFESRGVNHVWMQPAVSEVYIHPGTPRDCYRCDVGFVGAKDYHKEYPFRAELVNFLESQYRHHFKHVTGIRGHELNDVYASMKVIVGDCIFAGTPRYWSDRVPETIGRHGFLLHPEIGTLEVPVARYAPQNLEHLHKAIDYWLTDSSGRRETVRAGVEHVRKYDTWTVRMRSVIERAMG